MQRCHSERPLLLWIALLCLFAVSKPARTDGLIYQLPEDGSWVRYEAILHHWDYTPLHPPQEDIGDERRTQPREDYDRGVIVLKSVGRVRVNGEMCRWIELEAEPPATRRDTRAQVYKMLIPEQDLKDGADVLGHVKKMYYRPNKEVETYDGTDAAKLTYELDRIRKWFPHAPVQLTREKPYPMLTPDGRIEGQLLTFAFGFEGKLHGGKAGFYSNQCRYRLVLDTQVPFGVNFFEVEGEAVMKYADMRITDHPAHRGWSSKFREEFQLKASGKGAVTALPDCN